MKRFLKIAFFSFVLAAQGFCGQPLLAKANKKKGDAKIKSLSEKMSEERTAENYLAVLDLVEKAEDIDAEGRSDEAFSAFMEKAVGFLESLKSEVVSAPKAVSSGNSFAGAFSARYFWSQDGSPVRDLPVAIRFPDGDEVSSIIARTDENGIVRWNAPSPQRGRKSSVDFLAANQEKYAFASIPYVVSTKLKSAGGSIALVDYTKSGRPIASGGLSSSRLLAMLMKSGFTRIGNSDFVTQVASDNADAVQKAAKSLFGNSASYLIYGTVEYENVENADGIFTVALKGNLRVRSLAENRELLRTSFGESASKPTEAAAFQEAREKICRDMHDAILYGI